MFIARWTVDARFGKEETCMAILRKWQQEVGNKVGWKNARMTTGSIGALESRIEIEVQVKTLAELEQSWARFGDFPYHERFSEELEPNIVSGSPKWQVFRMAEL